MSKYPLRIQIGVAEEFEDVAMEGVGPGFRDDVHDCAGVAAIFGVEGIGENPELFNRIRTGFHGG